MIKVGQIRLTKAILLWYVVGTRCGSLRKLDSSSGYAGLFGRGSGLLQLLFAL
jgi:hypothetical protein